MTSENPKKSQLYTRTGDRGESSLYNGERRLKTDRIFEALGSVDELNSSIGIAHHYCAKSANGLESQLIEIQCNLQDIGSNIATPRHDASETQLHNTTFDEGHVETLERWIDVLDSQLPPLRNFILPSGGESSIFLHQARSICRRAERTTIPVVEAQDADETVLKYLNRLSDYLFAAARYAAKHDGLQENVYKKAKSGREASVQTRAL
ncbi:Adenosylcobalamin biosynthesis, ATP:cob(I)alamin adenosyltransferase-like protein [Lobosporangium transversale]|uniref:Corrinoid adenosyltransferase MMAB n=1 Tax=Lobosporangium transversale TaxID=64571 RepID=A0A1Y2GCS1_9FUNG|nr:Adenosylcobalamin biosynthesis, ATP:cob(I)alamin adenosyltransferase-like protein [Lobosporangium transversale]ORZ05939.1 Adenosylcobalamin biosynthesis, ATP:cob(I)alamin adenosyltransferase-like protein [Lobosporangium transversale]|eukprot:XP_021877320.1 Adenosylcobalamin biosynthesis, ATP:cob(I)alamin adenosyltransferase-like protein [Lobosporangium transversale]